MKEPLFKLVFPHRLRGYYLAFKKAKPVVDNSQVILFADEAYESGYRPRESLCANSQSLQRVSLIATVLNEVANLGTWLDSILAQVRQPDEMVVVDGGSSDGTIPLIREFARMAPFTVRLIESPGANIAQGRNLAIREATHAIIACTDSGCRLDRNWLQFLVKPFEIDGSIELSVGYYQPLAMPLLLADLFIPDLALDPQRFLPSSRSLAMKKEFWACVGGYPEWLRDVGEDTYFDVKAKSLPARWAFVPQAVVYWRGPGTLSATLRTAFRYARGDGEAGLFAPEYWKQTRFMGECVLLSGIILLGLVSTPAAGIGGWLVAGLALLAAFHLFARFTGLFRHGISQRFSRSAILFGVTAAKVIGFAVGASRRVDD